LPEFEAVFVTGIKTAHVAHAPSTRMSMRGKARCIRQPPQAETRATSLPADDLCATNSTRRSSQVRGARDGRWKLNGGDGPGSAREPELRALLGPLRLHRRRRAPTPTAPPSFRRGPEIAVRIEDDTLYVHGLWWPRSRLIYKSPDLFLVESLCIELPFQRDATGRVTRMLAAGQPLGALLGTEFVRQ
jgi:hypothetical protein